MCRFQHLACVDFNKPWAQNSQNTACSLQLTACHCIIDNYIHFFHIIKMICAIANVIIILLRLTPYCTSTKFHYLFNFTIFSISLSIQFHYLFNFTIYSISLSIQFHHLFNFIIYSISLSIQFHYICILLLCVSPILLGDTHYVIICGVSPQCGTIFCLGLFN